MKKRGPKFRLLLVACTECGAGEGETCRSAQDRPIPRGHAQRRRDAGLEPQKRWTKGETK
jgi:hypothetical protein